MQNPHSQHILETLKQYVFFLYFQIKKYYFWDQYKYINL